jgi:hypothetical protein
MEASPDYVDVSCLSWKYKYVADDVEVPGHVEHEKELEVYRR